MPGKLFHSCLLEIYRQIDIPIITFPSFSWNLKLEKGIRISICNTLSIIFDLTERDKTVIIELDKNDKKRDVPELVKIEADGRETKAGSFKAVEWGEFLRYNYLKCDFTSVKQEGIYIVRYGNSESQPFRIASSVFKRDVWQPTIEYFLPVQMCHMKVDEKSRTWHGLCHMDDALMAPVNHVHFDGYSQGDTTYTSYKPGDHLPGLNTGGWHDAGDYDLRVESQSGEAYQRQQMGWFMIKTLSREKEQ